MPNGRVPMQTTRLDQGLTAALVLVAEIMNSAIEALGLAPNAKCDESRVQWTSLSI